MTHKKETPASLVGEKKAEVRDEAAAEVAKDAVKQEIEQSTGTESDVDSKASRFYGHDEIMQFEHVLDLSPNTFTDAISANADHPIAENKVFGLLALERNGKNRTPYVQAMMKRLDLKADELPGGGPPYTNDMTPTTKL